ncbi:RDD family protein [Microbacterium gilvum]|uniref:FHA domain-containing protein n=1 Tax=Microbacterium gilvum TaxID=1336204 RepID=A0ABP9A4S6_9MICO
MTTPAPHSSGRPPLPAGYGPAPLRPAPDAVAPLGRRALAYLVDVAVAVVGAGALGGLTAWAFLAGPLWLGAALAAVASVLVAGWWLLYSWLQGGRRGTPGMRWMGTRLVRADGGAPLGFGRALLRNVIWALAASIVVGYVSVLFDRSGRRQGWHDLVADALVLDARAASGPAPSDARGSAGLPLPPRAPAHRAQAAPASAAPVDAPAPVAPVPPSSAPIEPGLVIPPRPPLPAPVAPAPAELAPAEQGSGPERTVPPVPPTPPVPPRVDAAPPRAETDQVGGGALIDRVPGITQDPPPAPARAAVQPAAAAARAGAEPTPARAVPEPTPTSAVPEPTPAPAGPAASAPAWSDDDLSDETIIPGERSFDPLLDDTVVVRRPAARPTTSLIWDDGAAHTIDGVSLFGRNPSGDGDRIAVRDETLSLSKTHFSVDVDADGAWIVDLHSTNGVAIVRGDERIEVVPGERTALHEGDVLELGDRTATVGDAS